MPARPTSFRAPFLKELSVRTDALDGRAGYPFDLEIVRTGRLQVRFEGAVTVIVGENGTGKSTLLEAIAEAAGFGVAGGTRDHVHADAVTERYREAEFDGLPNSEGRKRALAAARHDPRLTDALRFSWCPKVGQGFFFRAETFHRLARYLDEAAMMGLGIGAPPEHLKRSHAEGFLDFFIRRFAIARQRRRPHLFLFDEPESALSPARQLEFLARVKQLTASGLAQVIITTHSPLLMAIPGCQLLLLTRGDLRPCALTDTPHFQEYRSFFEDPAWFISERIHTETARFDEEHDDDDDR